MKRQMPTRGPTRRIPVDVVRFRRALGVVIAEVRDGMGMTQEAFAATLGLDQTTVAKAETGIHLWRLETWLEVSRALKIPFYELFRRAAERDSMQGGSIIRRVEALDEQEVGLVRVWRQLTVEGQEILSGRANACLELYHREDNVVPLVHGGKGRKASS